jgi:hypothetical protein
MANDPCGPQTVKQSTPINITTATTTTLVAGVGGKFITPCSFIMTIDSIVTTATTAQFIEGTGGNCTGPTNVSGLFGAGGVTAGPPIVITYNDPLKKLASGHDFCLLSAGTTVQIQGVLSYTQ